MTGDFRELVFGDVLVAPFVTYAVASFLILVLLRPLLTAVGFDRLLSNPPLGAIALYAVIIAVLIVLT